MKKLVVLAMVLAFFAGASYRSIGVKAQSMGVSPSAATTLAGCPAPAANFMNFCQVTGDPANASGAYVTANGAPYFLLKASAGTAGVVTFNGRSGNVAATANDYSYSQLSGKPTTISCSTSSQSNTGFTASGCSIN